MKKLHLHRFFDLVNAQVFNDMLPKTKLAISYKPSDVFGLCEVGAFYGQKISQQKITINYHSLYEFDILNEDEIKRTLIHEMVHLWVAILAGRDYSRTTNIFLEHDKEVFDSIGSIAFDLGLIEHGDLLI